LQRFAPAIKELFPETNDGIIESSHTELKHAEELKGITLESFSGPVYAKLDNCLPISGSVKARGGIYEVLWFAEQVALQEGIITWIATTVLCLLQRHATFSAATH